LESLRVINVKKLENRFAPLYFKRITYKLQKDAKTFSFALYFSLINIMYTKKLYYPCVTLLSLLIEEINIIKIELYKNSKSSQKIQSFLYLFEYVLFIQVYILILLKNYERALFELRRINEPINLMNKLLHKILLGFCLGQCLYLDFSVYELLEASFVVKEFIDTYNIEETEEENQEKDKDPFMKKEQEYRKTAPESNINH